MNQDLNEYHLTIDRKVTVWMREHHTVKAETREDAVKFLADALVAEEDTCLLQSSADKYETLVDSEHPMTIEDNDGESTVEIVDHNAPYDTLWNNKDGYELKLLEHNPIA